MRKNARKCDVNHSIPLNFSMEKCEKMRKSAKVRVNVTFEIEREYVITDFSMCSVNDPKISLIRSELDFWQFFDINE